jgi:23S rRNA (uracil1939-C5)-methyltransferase
MKPQRRRRPEAPPSTAPVALAIDRIGGRGDGIGMLEGKPVYVAGSLPGERIEAQLVARRGEGWQARLVRVIAASPERIAPACAHFGICGGCALQHLTPEAYRAAKRDRITQALRRAGLGDIVVRRPAGDASR